MLRKRQDMLRIIILAILATFTDQKKIPDNPYLVDLIDVLCKNGGKWILAAAGSNNAPPPYKSCIEVTVTDTGEQSGCILAEHYHKVHKTKIVRFSGVNENNETEVVSKAPIHQYMIKSDRDNIAKEVRNEVDWDAAITSPMCWNQETHRIRRLRYVITPIDETNEHLYLVAVNAKSPVPDYQVAILTKTKLRRRYLERLMKKVDYRNFLHLEARWDSPGLFTDHGLPRLQMKCAEGFDILNPYDTINQDYLDIEFSRKSPLFPAKEYKTILVKHNIL